MMVPCDEPGCNARVVAGKHKKCSRHRPKVPNPYYKQVPLEERQAKNRNDQERRQRRRGSVGLSPGWTYG